MSKPNSYYTLRRKSRLREQGKCTQCGIEITKENYNGQASLCSKCTNKDRERCRIKRQRWKEKGICVRCGKQPVKEGRTSCSSCLAGASRRKINGRKIKSGTYIDDYIKDFLKQFGDD